MRFNCSGGNKFWGELKRLEAKKAYIYSSLEKYIRENEQLYMIHKDLAAKAHSIIKFLKFFSNESLRAFKIHDKFQIIHLVQRIIDKDISLQNLRLKIEYLQKEIKDVYSLFKPLIEKGLPHFGYENNCLLKKEDYDNFFVQKRNYHS